jgi:hypothetical protein
MGAAMKSAYAALSRLEENPPENISELLNEPSLISILMPRTLSPSHRTPINVDRFVRGEQNLRIGRRLVADWCGFLGAQERLCVSTASIGTTFLVHRPGRPRRLLSQMNLRDAQFGELMPARGGCGFKLASTN